MPALRYYRRQKREISVVGNVKLTFTTAKFQKFRQLLADDDETDVPLHISVEIPGLFLRSKFPKENLQVCNTEI